MNQKTLLVSLNNFRKDPTSVTDDLVKRRERYFQSKGKIYLASQMHEKKIMAIRQKQLPRKRIQELMGILYGETIQPLGQLSFVEGLSRVARKVCENIDGEISKEHSIHTRKNAREELRGMLNEDSNHSYPDKVACLISLSFNEENEPLLNLLVDDDNLDRSNRKELLLPHYRYVGIGSVPLTYCYAVRCTVYLLTTNVIAKN